MTALYSGEIKEAEEGSTIRITVGYPDFANAEIILYESKVEDKKLFSQTMEQGVVLSVYHVLEQDTITEQVNLYLNDQLIRTDQIVFAKE